MSDAPHERDACCHVCAVSETQRCRRHAFEPWQLLFRFAVMGFAARNSRCIDARETEQLQTVAMPCGVQLERIRVESSCRAGEAPTVSSAEPQPFRLNASGSRRDFRFEVLMRSVVCAL